ncbi:MAG: cell wall-binding repeat-containing protein [Actinomycetota bacterium]|nr:cell wall-binding repeat-containing protein [Actinomycetota bacterium]
MVTAKSKPTILTNDANEVAGNWEISLPEGADTIEDTDAIKIEVGTGDGYCATTDTGIGFAALPTIPATFGVGALSGTCNEILTINLANDFEAGDEALIENVRYKVAVKAKPGAVVVSVDDEAAVGAASNAILARVDQPYAGSVRFDTAAKIALDAYGKDTVDTCVAARRVIVASGADANFPDALAASALAGKRNVPILLVNPTLPIPTQTLDAIDKLGVQNITVVGGSAAVTSEVFNALDGREIRACGGGDLDGSATIHVERMGGAVRYDTSRLIADAVGAGNFDNFVAGECDPVKTVLMVSGVNYPDALAIGPLAARGSSGCGADSGQLPILLTAPGELSAATQEALTALAPKQVIIIGGTAAVSQTTENAVLAHAAVENVERIAGDIREETAAEIAKVLINPNLGGFSATRAFVTTGRNFPDALAIGPIAGANEAPIVLTTNSSTLGEDGTATLNDNLSILHASLVGGTTVLTNSVRNAVGVAFTSRPSTP